MRWTTSNVLDPLCDVLREKINRKRSGYAGFTNGTYVGIDTRAVGSTLTLSVSTAIGKLIGSARSASKHPRLVGGGRLTRNGQIRTGSREIMYRLKKRYSLEGVDGII